MYSTVTFLPVCHFTESSSLASSSSWPFSIEYIRWIVNEDLDPKTLDLASDTKRIQDLKGNHLLLFTSYWSIDWALDHNKGLELREFGTN